MQSAYPRSPFSSSPCWNETAYSPSHLLYLPSNWALHGRLHFSKVLGSWAVILEAARWLSSAGSLTSPFASHKSHHYTQVLSPRRESPPADNAEGVENRESRCDARELTLLVFACSGFPRSWSASSATSAAALVVGYLCPRIATCNDSTHADSHASFDRPESATLIRKRL
jgi:hypothetical protein